MSESEAAVSGDVARLIANLIDPRKLVDAHRPDEKGRCPACKSIGCSLYATALAALEVQAKRATRHGGLRAKGASA